MKRGTTQPRGTGRGGNSGKRKGGSTVEERSTRTRRGGWKNTLIRTITVIGTFLGTTVPAAANELVSNLAAVRHSSASPRVRRISG